MKDQPGAEHVSRRINTTEDESVLTVYQQHEIPQAISALSTIVDPDFIDVFTFVTRAASVRSSQQWARAASEDVAGIAGQFISRVLLGLRLAWRQAPAHVAGCGLKTLGLVEVTAPLRNVVAAAAQLRGGRS